MARRPKRAEHDNLDRWMVSYADFVTLLFAFFVVMYGISTVNEGKYKVFGAAINKAFGTKSSATEGGSIRLTEEEIYFKSLVDRRNARLAEKQRKQNERMQNLAKTLNEAMEKFVKNGQMNVSQTGRGVELEINASALFNQGEADIQPEAKKTLADAAKVLVDNEQELLVKLTLFVTHDFLMEILSFGENVKVIKPVSLMEEVKTAFQHALNQY